jgi:hypothetical protein
MKSDLKNIVQKDDFLQKGHEFLKQKKEIKSHSDYFSVLKIHTLSYYLILWV